LIAALYVACASSYAEQEVSEGEGFIFRHKLLIVNCLRIAILGIPPKIPPSNRCFIPLNKSGVPDLLCRWMS
jgi:hypothetical protein